VNTPPLITLQGLRKSYNLGRPNETEVLHGLDLQIAPGEFVALIGPSGSGKSTLLNVLGLLEPPTAGSYRLQGRETAGLGDEALTLARRETLGFVFQFHHLLPAFSALENVTLPALMHAGHVSTAARDTARAMLQAVGLGDALHKRPGELSGGMQQRVGLARAFATEAPILLMDEPFSALDPLIRAKLQDELLDLQATLKRTIVFVSHDLDEAFKIGNRIALLEGGRLVQVGTAREIIANPVSEYVAEFVAHMNPLGVLTARDVMVAGAGGSGQSVEAETPVKVLMEMLKGGAADVTVTDQGQPIGRVQATDVLARLLDPRGQA